MNQVDIKIRDGLLRGLQQDEIAEEIYNYLNTLKDIEKIKQSKLFFKFLWCTQDSLLFSKYFFKAWDDGYLVMPWGHWLDLLLQTVNNQLPEVILHAIQKSLEVTNGSGESKKSKRWDLFEVQNKSRREASFQKNQEKYLANKQNILKQLKLAQSQGMKESEKKLILQLKKYNPQNALVLDFEERQQEKKAATLVRRRRDQNKSLFQLQKYSTVEPEITQAAQIIFEAMQDQLKTLSSTSLEELGYEFSVALMMMSLPDEAMTIIQTLPPSKSILWLYYECLLAQKRHVEILSLLVTIEQNLANESETFAATAYARAQAYWGLGDLQRASSIMESLVETYPEYRSAEVLLSTWRNP